MDTPKRKSLRSEIWFNDMAEPGETAVYLERYPSYGITRQEMQSGRPIIGIAQTGGDLTPCNRIHMTLVERVKAGIRDAGGVPFEFPVHPIQESCRRPTAALDRNLAYLGIVEVLCGYPLDGVVLLTGCDKTTPACLMAVATVNMPAIALNGGPMINSYYKGKLAGSGIDVYKRQVLGTRYDPEKFPEALRQLRVVVRGPKPAAVMREWQIPIAVQAPEPNTWRELLAALEGRPERRTAVQEYGKANLELLGGLRARGHEVTTIRVYEWDLPEDTGPLREAVRRLAEGKIDVALFTTSIQVAHLFRIAAEEKLEAEVRGALQKVMIASIGPTTSEELVEYGIRPDMEPSHPKMGLLVNEAAQRPRK